MAQVYSTGPPLAFVGIGSGGSLQFLGTCKRGPRIRIKRHWAGVYNDLAGDEPHDWSYLGQSAMVTLSPLTRWNEPVYAALAAEPNPFRQVVAAPLRGLEFPPDMGTLMGTEGLARNLVIAYPYGGLTGKAAYATLPAGYLFFSTFLLGPDELAPSIHAYEVSLTFYCMRSFAPPTALGALIPEYSLYTTILPALPPVN